MNSDHCLGHPPAEELETRHVAGACVDPPHKNVWEDRERGLRDCDLGLLLVRGVEDREQEERLRRLGDIRLVRGDVRQPMDDRLAGEEGERHLCGRDTSLASLLVLLGSDDPREREGRVLDRRRGAGEWLRWLAVECGEAQWCLGLGLRQQSSWEHEWRPGLRLMALCRLDGSDSLSGDEEGLESRLRDRRSLLDRDLSPEGIRDLELLLASFDADLGWAHNASRLPEGLSALQPIFCMGIEGPAVGWGGAAPNIFIILFSMACKNTSCQLCIKAWTSGTVFGVEVTAWEGVTAVWVDVEGRTGDDGVTQGFLALGVQKVS